MKKLNKDMIIAGLLTGLSLGALLIIVDNTYMTNKNLELVIIIFSKLLGSIIFS